MAHTEIWRRQEMAPLAIANVTNRLIFLQVLIIIAVCLFFYVVKMQVCDTK